MRECCFIVCLRAAEGTHTAPEDGQTPSGAERSDGSARCSKKRNVSRKRAEKNQCSVSRWSSSERAQRGTKCSKVREAAKDDVGPRHTAPEARSQSCRHAPPAISRGSSAQSCWLKERTKEPLADFALSTTRQAGGAELLVVAKKGERAGPPKYNVGIPIPYIFTRVSRIPCDSTVNRHAHLVFPVA